MGRVRKWAVAAAMCALCACALFAGSDAALEFGAFSLRVREFSVCAGPKRRDCCDVRGSLGADNRLDYDILVKENVRPTKGKIVAMAGGKETLRLQLKNPCNHLFLRPLLTSMLNVTADCLVLKGRYHFAVDIEEVARRYYGGDFIFGRWTFKSVFYNEQCNFSCSVLQVEMMPKNKTVDGDR